MKKQILILILFSSLFITTSNLVAEVEEVILRWNAVLCLETCVPGIERNLAGIRQVSNLQINGRSGIATMGWNPSYPFSYEPFRLAMSAAGIAILDMRLRIRGTITHDSNNVYLISNGDGARFRLLGALVVDQGRYIPRYSMETHPLPPSVKAQLLDAELKGYTVIISGPMYLPAQYPLIITAEQIKILSKESEMDPRYRR
ncbi:MAG: hypothetical protein Q8S01_10230 [Ignavibacteria bacterium]|nr:hypothetical protein [Ignavibacteria bacterium]